MKTDPLKPSVPLLVKLGSIVVHTEEMLSLGGHRFDLNALEALFGDADIKERIDQMTKMAMLPVKR